MQFSIDEHQIFYFNPVNIHFTIYQTSMDRNLYFFCCRYPYMSHITYLKSTSLRNFVWQSTQYVFTNSFTNASSFFSSNFRVRFSVSFVMIVDVLPTIWIDWESVSLDVFLFELLHIRSCVSSLRRFFFRSFCFWILLVLWNHTVGSSKKFEIVLRWLVKKF